MLKATVVGSVWSTKRVEGLPSGAFLEVEVQGGGSNLVVFDVLGSGMLPPDVGNQICTRLSHRAQRARWRSRPRTIGGRPVPRRRDRLAPTGPPVAFGTGYVRACAMPSRRVSSRVARSPAPRTNSLSPQPHATR